MAESQITFLAEVAITLLLEKLIEIRKWHSKLISGSENDFEELCKGLHFLKAFFEDASNHPKMTEMFRSEMDSRIIDLVFDIEDAIEAWLVNAESSKIMVVVIRHHLYPFTLSIAKMVRRLRIRKLTPIYAELKHKFHQHVASFAVVDVSNTDRPAFRVGIKSQSTPKLQEIFVGFKDEEHAILGKLMEETKELSVIAICGVNGSGKTTLAKKIFEDEKIWLEFPIRIWISACNNKRLNIRNVFLNILKRFIGDDLSNSSDHELARAVHLCLSEKKFVLVVDDLRSIGHWKAVEEALPRSNALGKVLITTKDLNTAKYASCATHMLRSLSDEESLELLRDCSTDPGLIDGEKLARESGGLPLAIVVIGGNLMDMYRENRIWTHFEETQNAKMKISGSVSLKSKLRELVELSYGRLPGYLKECFLYLAMFPKDHTIPTRKLMQLWIGEGFIPPKEGKALEATAEECLDELIRRKLVMVDSVNPIGEMISCRVHKVIHKFARSKAIERDVFQEMLELNQSVRKETTRLCLHFGLPEFLSEKQILRKPVRSIHCFHSEPVHLSLKLVATISHAFKPLRVLDAKFTEFPAWIAKLIHLRYVTLSIADLTVVPETISQLFNLQTFVVETKSPSITMKANIWRMYRLRHFQTKASIVLDTKFEGKGGESLQTVGRLSPKSCTDDFPERASNLRRLAIRGKRSQIIHKLSSFLLIKFHLLEDLKLVNDIDLSPSDMAAPLKGLHFPRALKKLTLCNTFLKWEHMSKLANIKTLEVLKLKENAFTGIHWSAVDYRFLKLQFLLIANTDLVHWEASANSFPQLTCLVIKMCENLNEIPEAVFNKLSKLYIERVGKYAVQSAWKIAKSKASRGFKLSVC